MNFFASLLFVTLCKGQSNVYSNWANGTSYFFDQDSINAGSCGYATIPTETFPFGYVAAANYIVYNNSALCGACFEVECVNSTQANAPDCCNNNGTSVTVQVTDTCASSACSDRNYFGLSKDAFSKIANTGCGITPMRYRRVACEYQDHIELVNKDGINEYWYAMFVVNIADYGTLGKVYIRDQNVNSTWSEGVRSDFNFWEFENPSGWKLPLSVHLVDSNGNQLTSDNVVTDVDDGSVFDFGQNF